MHLNRIGQATIVLPRRPRLIASAAIAGKKEGEGPLRAEFDRVIEDDLFGEETWEKAESRFQYEAATLALEKAGLTPDMVDVALGGDLLNQIMAASLAMREMHIPFLGLYGACSTMAESLCLGSILVDGGYARHALCTVSSHFCTAERQYRFPLEYGCQRPPTAQWTVTGSGSIVLSQDDSRRSLARATHVTIGRIVDMSIKDANNMGAAMAPAAADTLARHFADTGRTCADYDLILSGDLGRVGHDVLLELMQQQGVPLDPARYDDCGLRIFVPGQDTHCGGSGCGCSAVVLAGQILRQMQAGALRRVLFMATGALLSTTTSQQGDSIPGIAHAIALEADI
ncbi:MAG: stage V sporulation protein AD [Clostridia bacterium]|nr:stage V sporulation protein AD [Clostridia bacterium]